MATDRRDTKRRHGSCSWPKEGITWHLGADHGARVGRLRSVPWQTDSPDRHRVSDHRGDRMLRRVVYAYLVSVVVAGVIALVGLHEGLW